jgi:hypothetical protein
MTPVSRAFTRGERLVGAREGRESLGDQVALVAADEAMTTFVGRRRIGSVVSALRSCSSGCSTDAVLMRLAG